MSDSSYQDMADSPSIGKLTVCVYVLHGLEVSRLEQAHPGIYSHTLKGHEEDSRGRKVVYSWDHIGPKGEHYFRGTTLPKV